MGTFPCCCQVGCYRNIILLVRQHRNDLNLHHLILPRPTSDPPPLLFAVPCSARQWHGRRTMKRRCFVRTRLKEYMNSFFVLHHETQKGTVGCSWRLGTSVCLSFACRVPTSVLPVYAPRPWVLVAFLAHSHWVFAAFFPFLHAGLGYLLLSSLSCHLDRPDCLWRSSPQLSSSFSLGFSCFCLAGCLSLTRLSKTTGLPDRRRSHGSSIETAVSFDSRFGVSQQQMPP